VPDRCGSATLTANEPDHPNCCHDRQRSHEAELGSDVAGESVADPGEHRRGQDQDDPNGATSQPGRKATVPRARTALPEEHHDERGNGADNDEDEEGRFEPVSPGVANLFPAARLSDGRQVSDNQ
jgi:hypothetical protein